ncbi:zinc finger domain-containing protein [Brevibacterium sp. BRM-1]|uniref:zinc finger domain-containing protein n=1 Tax=Brevibacterium sp. BRM-1 TaxID=2999062 RepID=UPI003FA464C7
MPPLKRPDRPGDSPQYHGLQRVLPCWIGSASRVPIHSRVDWRLDSLVSERHKLVESGYFERSLAVYGRAGEPCRRCGAPIRRLTVAGRTTHVCPRCQPAQRLRGGPRWRAVQFPSR